MPMPVFATIALEISGFFYFLPKKTYSRKYEKDFST